MRIAAITVVLTLALLAPAARAHEVALRVVRDGAVAVRVVESDGQPLAGAGYQLWAPGEAQPWQEGRTDREGWLAFVPGPTGRWRLKVVEAGGHGLDTSVEVSAPAAGGEGAAAAAKHEAPRGSPDPGSAGFVLRPLAAVAVIAVVFAMLLALYRKKGRAP